MKNRYRKVLPAALLSLALVGCAGTSTPMLAGADIDIAVRPTSYITVTEASAARTGKGLHLRGSLRRTGRVHLTGHVDVVVVGPDGTAVFWDEVAVPGLNSRRKGSWELPFSATVAGAVPEGSTVILRYHTPPFTEEPGEKSVI